MVVVSLAEQEKPVRIGAREGGNRGWRCERRVVSSEQADRQGKDRGFGRHRSQSSWECRMMDGC